MSLSNLPPGVDVGDDLPSECNGGCANCAPGEQWVYTGTQYGGDDESFFGEGRCYCQFCGADGDA